MTHYIYVESATGRNISQTSDPDVLNRIRPGYEVVQVPDEDIKGLWNPTTKSFDTRPKTQKLSTHELLTRFNAAEIEALVDSAETKAKAFVFIMSVRKFFDTFDPEVIAMLNGLESVGLLKAVRVTEILR